MNINLNQAVSVTLTATGATQYNAWNKQFQSYSFEVAPVPTGHVLRGQLWHLFQVFGHYLYLGMGEVPFVGCNIEIEGELI